ncbi:MAG: phosphohistidine phosphatase SixA [Cyanobacteria bacterium P01_A01_bin.40]
MEVYLIRHGIAAERGTYTDDEQRPLVKKGREKTSKVAQYLLTTGLRFERILSSPLVRATQTAEILQQAGLAETIDIFDPLRPGGAIASWLEWLQQYRLEHHGSKLALVGHQPDLGNWTELLLGGSIRNQIVVKKAGVIGLELPAIGTPIARSTLFLLTSPKWMINN